MLGQGKIIFIVKALQAVQFEMEDDLEFTFEQFHREYEILELLGEGKFGKVHKVRHLPTKTYCAIKIIQCFTREEAQNTQQEIQIMMQLDHPNIVKIFKHYRINQAKNSQKGHCSYGLLMELGLFSLQHCLKKKSYQYSVVDVRLFLAKLIALGAYLEDRKLVHRDIKPLNIIIFGPRLEFKLADFGLCCLTDQRPPTFCGTVSYSSPQLVQFYWQCKKGRKSRPISNAFKDDVYSVGVTINEVLSSLNGSWNFQKYDSFHSQFIKTINQMLEVDERKRPTFIQLMQSQFIREELNLCPLSQSQSVKSIEFENQPFNIRLEKEKETIKKPHDFEIERQNMYTQQEKYRLELKKPVFFQVEFSPRSVCRVLERYILCGCQHGQLIIFDCQNGEHATLSVRHGKYVARVAVDQTGNIWSAGGDGSIYFFGRNRLLDCISNKKVVKQYIRKSIYGPAVTVRSMQIFIDEGDYKVLHKFTDKRCISYFQVINQQHYFIGYASGEVYVCWGGKQCQFQNNFEVVTAFRVIDFQLYTSFYNGAVTKFNLKTFKKENQIYKFTDTIIDFNVTHCKKEGLSIEAVTCSGCIEKLQIATNKNISFCQELLMKNLMGACSVDSDWYSLSLDGKLLRNNEEMFICPLKKGWISLALSENSLIGCSAEGMLLLAELVSE